MRLVRITGRSLLILVRNWCILVLGLHFVSTGRCAMDTVEDTFVLSKRERAEKILHTSLMVQFLSSVRGSPVSLSMEEMEELRQSTPTAVQKHLQIMNNRRFLEDVRTNIISKTEFQDMQKSLIFLESVQCSLTRDDVSRNCLIIRHPVDLPEDPIAVAKLSTFVLPWIVSNQLTLTAYFLDPEKSRFTEDMFQLGNSSEVFGTYPVSFSSQREVEWEITAAIVDLQRRKDENPLPVVLTLDCLSEKCRTNTQLWKLFQKPSMQNAILTPNSQAAIVAYTKSTLAIVRNYSRRRLTGRSLIPDLVPRSEQSCPSFLDRDHRESKCCLFRFTLTREQLDQNDKLRFIVFPHHLPLNVCHGRCIGLYVPTDNSHSVLLNRYFAGLTASEREAVYDAMPCCAANETSPFTIIYKDQTGTLIQETLVDAVKMNCACN